MTKRFECRDWREYKMDYARPHLEIEPAGEEIAVVDAALAFLVEVGVLPHARYENSLFLAHRNAVAELFEIPWTAITPRMQRFLYALNAIRKPANMIAAGVFCGNTFISNAGAAVGPGACYTAKQCIGVEIKPDEAERAERNVRRIDPTGVARVVAEDALDVATAFMEPVDLLYLDADGAGGRGKAIYQDITMAAYSRLSEGALILAHNSVNGADALGDYFAYVRERRRFKESVNVVIDGEGLEVTAR